MKGIKCFWFWRLVRLGAERELEGKQVLFLERHRAACRRCRAQEALEEQALSFLRDSSLEPIESSNYEARLLRRLRVDALKRTVSYWSPAFVGAVVAGVAVLSVIQLLSQPDKLPSPPNRAHEVKRSSATVPPFPDLNIRTNNTTAQ